MCSLVVLLSGLLLASCGNPDLYPDNSISVSIDGGAPVVFTAGPSNGSHAGIPVISYEEGTPDGDFFYMIASADGFAYDEFGVPREGVEIDFNHDPVKGESFIYGPASPDSYIYFCQVGGTEYTVEGEASGTVVIENVAESTGQVEGRLSGTVVAGAAVSHTIEVLFSVYRSNLSAYNGL